MCSQATAGVATGTFNRAGTAYSGDEVSIEMGLQLAPIAEGTPVKFSLLLDDEQGRVCGTDAKDQSLDTFVAGTGSTTVQQDKFHYVIHHHMHYRMN